MTGQPAGVGRTATLVTADQIRLSAHYDPPVAGTADPPAAGTAGTSAVTDPVTAGLGIVLAHGFTGSWRRPAVRRAATALARVGGVVSFDFRGHGRSGGRSTVGDREVLDLAAATGWAHRLGHTRIATVGFSMGAAVALRHAATATGLVAVVAVSGPSRWYYRDTAAMRQVHWVIETRLGRLTGRVLRRTRVAAAGWDPVPEPPDLAAARIAPTPLLIVHGDADAFFPTEHAHALYAAAGEPRELWIEPGFGHAENAAPAGLLDRIAGWVADRSGADADRPAPGPPVRP